MRRYIVYGALLSLLGATESSTVYDDAYIKSLEARLSALEAKSKTHNSKGSLELKSYDTILSIGGRVRMDIIHNDPSVGGAANMATHHDDILFSPYSVNSDNPEEERNNLAFSGRESRLWVKTRKPTEYGMLLTLLEIDFIVADAGANERVSNSHGPRLTHAYFQLGKLTAGQTNSTFMGSGNAELIRSQMDNVFARQPLVRWTENFDASELQLAIEQPESTVYDTGGSKISSNDEQLPDLVAKTVWYGRWGEVSLSALARELRVDSDVVPGKSDAKQGGAVQLAGRFKTFGSDTLYFGYSTGNALGRYIAGAAFASGNIDGNGTIGLQNVSGGHLSYRHWWGQATRSTLSYGKVWTENDTDILPNTTIKSSDSAHLNLLWSPIENSVVGIETIHANKELENGKVYALDRIQVMASYDF